MKFHLFADTYSPLLLNYKLIPFKFISIRKFSFRQFGEKTNKTRPVPGLKIAWQIPPRAESGNL
jgi:hypothetical protein